MKVYYDSDGTPTWTLISAIAEYPTLVYRNNTYGSCTIVLRDFEGGLFATWEARDFTDMKVTDDDDNTLFRGFLINKVFDEKSLTLYIVGFSIMLEWLPFYKSYILAEGLIKTSAASDTVTVWRDVDGDEVYDGGGEDFAWTVDYWHTDQDVGLLIMDNTSDVDSETWQVSSLTTTGGAVVEAGNKDSCDTQDGTWYYVTENSSDWDDTITIVLGEGIPFATAKKIHKITINYRIGIYSPHGGVKDWYLKILNTDAEWTTVLHVPTGFGTAQFSWFGGNFVLPVGSDAELLKFLTVDGANYDEVTELKMSWTNTLSGAAKAYIKIDVLTATIEYFTDEIEPIMSQITDSAANTLTCSKITDFLAAGVVGYDATAPGDIFRIGENTLTVIGDIGKTADLSIDILGQTTEGSSTQVLRPNGDGTQTEWSFDDSGGDGSHYKDVDEVVVDPNAGDTNIVYTSHNSPTWVEEEFDFETVAMGGAKVTTKIDLHTYGTRTMAGGLCLVYMFTTSTGWSASRVPIDSDDGSYAWKTVTWDNLTLDQADLDSLQIRFQGQDLAGFGAIVKIDTCYVTATYGTWAPFDKFIARIFRGTHCIDALKSVCNLEGADWMEDHEGHRIIVSKPSAYEDSSVVLNENDYDHDWEFEDKCNQVSRVDVWGNAAYNIHETVYSDTATGNIAKQIIDESISTAGDAREVATVQIEKLETKRPSLKLTLNGTHPLLQLGKTVNITLVRPTVSADDYPIRMIERFRRGIDGIKTIIHAGLGHTAADEAIGKTIRDIGYLANKALSDRLISTPWSAGASISWSDVGGAQSAVETIINTEVGAGESIDNAIDALIATHTAIDYAHLSGTQCFKKLDLHENVFSAGPEKTIDAVNEYVGVSFVLNPDEVDTSADIKVHWYYRCTTTDAALAMKKYVSAIKTNNTENHSWNVHSAVAFNLNTTNAFTSYYTWTIANAAIDDNDWIDALFMLNEASRLILVSSAYLEYTHT